MTDIHIERNHFRQHKIGFFSRVPFFCSHLGLWRDFEICFELNLSNSALNKSGEMYEKEEVFFVHESEVKWCCLFRSAIGFSISLKLWQSFLCKNEVSPFQPGQKA